MKPGEELKYTRFLAVGRSPLEAVGLVAELRGRVGGCYGVLKDEGGAPVTTAQIILQAAGDTPRESASLIPTRMDRSSSKFHPAITKRSSSTKVARRSRSP
jgi:hypothetical protein